MAPVNMHNLPVPLHGIRPGRSAYLPNAASGNREFGGCAAYAGVAGGSLEYLDAAAATVQFAVYSRTFTA